jgi:DNA-binding LacI/PurR family transcriptional regulator
VPVQKKIEHIQALKDEGYPFVLIMRSFNELETNAVVMENEQDAFRAAEHLIKLGHRRIAFIRGRQTSYEIQGREKGYCSALRAYRIDADPELIVGNGCSAQDGYEAARKIIAMPNAPSALLVSENVIIVGVLQALFDAGLSIPNDFSVVSFADMTFSPFFSTPLTSVSMPIEQIGIESLHILFKQIAQPHRHLSKVKKLSGQFSIRNSTLKAYGS